MPKQCSHSNPAGPRLCGLCRGGGLVRYRATILTPKGITSRLPAGPLDTILLMLKLSQFAMSEPGRTTPSSPSEYLCEGGGRRDGPWPLFERSRLPRRTSLERQVSPHPPTRRPGSRPPGLVYGSLPVSTPPTARRATRRSHSMSMRRGCAPLPLTPRPRGPRLAAPARGTR